MSKAHEVVVAAKQLEDVTMLENLISDGNDKIANLATELQDERPGTIEFATIVDAMTLLMEEVRRLRVELVAIKGTYRG